MTLRELSWMGEAKQRGDWERVSMLCALTANCHSTKKRFAPKDFNPFAREQKTEVMHDQKAALSALKSFLPSKKGKTK